LATAQEIAARMILRGAKGMKDSPFMQGLDMVWNLVEEGPRGLEQFSEDVVTGLIPNIIRDLRIAVDPVTRRPRSVSEAVANMFPGYSKNVPPSVDLSGQERVREPSLGLRATKQVSSPTEDKVSRVLSKVGWAPLEEKPILRAGDKKVELEGSERAQYLAEVGAATDRAILNVASLQGFDKMIEAGTAQGELTREIARARADVRTRWKHRKRMDTR